MNPYRQFVSQFERLAHAGTQIPLGRLPCCSRPVVAPDAPKALIFSPHPDDECIIGGLALRLLRETRMNVFNVPVTLGSQPERRAARFAELKQACDFLGFGVLPAAGVGLDRIHPETRQTDPAHWLACVQTIAKLLALHQPKIIFFPHEADWNRTHLGTHFLLMAALKCQPAEFACFVVETEFWGAMSSPNLMVESSVDDVGDLVAATSFHAGEVRRNPYHVRLPAWMMDNVRRGAELVGGQGASAPNFAFATLYRLWKWTQSRITNARAGGIILSKSENPAQLFA